MDIYVMDIASNVLGLIENYRSCIWNMQYFSKNDFEIVTAADAKTLELLKVGNLLVRDFDRTGTKLSNVMLIENIEISFDSENGFMITATGSGIKNVLRRRIIWSQMNFSGTVESAIRSVVEENAIFPTELPYLRTIPNLYLSAPIGLDDTADMQVFGENVADWIETVCKTYGYGWDIYISEGRWMFELFKGTDRTYSQTDVDPVVFSPDFDNLYSYTYSEDRSSFFNAALVGGEDYGTAKRTASVGGSSYLNRHEIYIDGSSVSSNGEIITPEVYERLLESYGREQLAQYGIVKKVEGSIEPNGMYKLNEDYFLGDIVQISDGKTVNAKARIAEIIYSVDETGTSVVPTFSEWEAI